MGAIQPVNPLEVPRFSGIATFMRLPWVTDLTQLDVAMIGVPFDGGQSLRTGSRSSPRAIRDMSSGIKKYNVAMKVNPYEKLRVGDFGDFVTNPYSLEDSHKRIAEQMDRVLEAGVLPICLGGDQSITVPILRAIAKKHGVVSLIAFNAHHDTYDKFFGVKQYSAGTPFRRVVEEGLINPRKSVLIGLRGPTFEEHDFDFCREHGIRTVMMEEVYEQGISVAFEALDYLRDEKCYVTIDVDALDPAFAPGTTLPTPGGLSSADMIRMIRRLKGVSVVGFDVVEVQPMHDSGGVTAMLAGMLAYEFLSTR